MLKYFIIIISRERGILGIIYSNLIMDPETTKKDKTGFSLNKTKVNEFGFNLSSDNKYISHK